MCLALWSDICRLLRHWRLSARVTATASPRQSAPCAAPTVSPTCLPASLAAQTGTHRNQEETLSPHRLRSLPQRNLTILAVSAKGSKLSTLHCSKQRTADDANVPLNLFQCSITDTKVNVGLSTFSLAVLGWDTAIVAHIPNIWRGTKQQLLAYVQITFAPFSLRAVAVLACGHPGRTASLVDSKQAELILKIV